MPQICIQRLKLPLIQYPVLVQDGLDINNISSNHLELQKKGQQLLLMIPAQQTSKIPTTKCTYRTTIVTIIIIPTAIFNHSIIIIPISILISPLLLLLFPPPPLPLPPFPPPSFPLLFG